MIELFSGLFLMAWGLYSFICIGLLVRVSRRLWKDDWFWMISNKGAYLGWLLNVAYVMALVPLMIWSQDWALLAAFGIQIPISILLLMKRPAPTRQEMLAYFAFPFFMFPLWFAIKQARKTQPDMFPAA